MAYYITKRRKRYYLCKHLEGSTFTTIKSFLTREEAEKEKERMNKIFFEKMFPIEFVRKLAHEYETTDMDVKDLAQKYNLPAGHLRNALNNFTENGFNYKTIYKRKRRKKQKKYALGEIQGNRKGKVKEHIDKNVYTVWFETMKNLGYSTSQAWDKLYEITGEKRNEEAVISR